MTRTVVALLFVLLAAACNGSGTKSDSSTLRATPTPTLEPTATPSPTPEPTDSPTPTTKPTNTPIPKPTSTSVPTSKPKATTTFTVVPTIKQEDGQETGEGQTLKLGGDTTNEVLGIKDVGEKESETANEEADKKFPFLALIPIILGVTLMGSSFYYFLRKRKKDYNSDGE